MSFRNAPTEYQRRIGQQSQKFSLNMDQNEHDIIENLEMIDEYINVVPSSRRSD